jgi:hypothetical protein
MKREGALDSLPEVIDMRYTENWIPEEELPTCSGLVVVHKKDPNHGLSDDEIQDRLEFIRCYLVSIRSYN